MSPRAVRNAQAMRERGGKRIDSWRYRHINDGPLTPEEIEDREFRALLATAHLYPSAQSQLYDLRFDAAGAIAEQ